MSNERQTSRTIQIAVRVPLALHTWLLAQGRPQTDQVIEAIRLLKASKDLSAPKRHPRKAA